MMYAWTLSMSDIPVSRASDVTKSGLFVWDWQMAAERGGFDIC